MHFSYGNVFLTYVNELCIYLKLCLSSSQFQLRLRIDNGSANQYVLLIQLFSYVKESIYLIGSLPFFKCRPGKRTKIEGRQRELAG